MVFGWYWFFGYKVNNKAKYKKKKTRDIVDIAQVERRSRKHNVSSHYMLWVQIPGWPTKITSGLSDETLNQGHV